MKSVYCEYNGSCSGGGVGDSDCDWGGKNFNSNICNNKNLIMMISFILFISLCPFSYATNENFNWEISNHNSPGDILLSHNKNDREIKKNQFIFHKNNQLIINNTTFNDNENKLLLISKNKKSGSDHITVKGENLNAHMKRTKNENLQYQQHEQHQLQQQQQQQQKQQSNYNRHHRHHTKRTKNGLESLSSSSLYLTNDGSSSSSDSNSDRQSSSTNSRRRRKGQRQKMNKNALRLLSGIQDNTEGGGAYPPLFNIAPRAVITVNATCGQNGREEYCKLVDAYPHKTWETQCGICDDHSIDYEKHHPIESILDNSNGDWWQSPTLEYGQQNEYVTINLDLKQVYQVFFIMIKAAISPRPASWILERSIDNITFNAWQYFGLSDTDCQRRYNLPAQTGKYIFTSDSEVICTTQFSKPLPLENGEIHVSLLKNRPGAMEQTQELLNFVSARYIRIRFQGMHSTANADNSIGWLLDAISLQKRSFYSIKSIRISGRLDCHGHAERTRENDESDEPIFECICMHNTCGRNCEKCCSLYNEIPFRNGTIKDQNPCEKCQCSGHTDSCIYDESLGKGICQNCANFTSGYNCENCIQGYFRPYGASSEVNCQKCDCDYVGATGNCNQIGGECICRQGFEGDHCEFCSAGYKGESCTKCSCDIRGTMSGGECERQCQCKLHVIGENCSDCTPGYFALDANREEGCLKCYCSGISTSCKSSKISKTSYETLDGWKITDISRSVSGSPSVDDYSRNLIFGMYDLPNVEVVYWIAPNGYTGNQLKSYGSTFNLKVSWVVIRGDTSGKPNSAPNIALIGRNGMKIAYGDEIFDPSTADINILLTEKGWYHLPNDIKGILTNFKETEYHGDPVTRMQFMSVLSDIESVLVRGTYHTDQIESLLERAILNSGGSNYDENEFILVEECSCPLGHEGLSCENCAFGYVRRYENSSINELIGKCVQCPCNGHAQTCDLATGKCSECQHNTFGEGCERCKVGYYGNPLHGTPNDCKRCGCPLTIDSNNFSPSCQLKKLTLDINHFGVKAENNSEYVCTQCPIGYTGDHCEICDDGYYGDPTKIGSKCLPCPCNGGPCDLLTGECITCSGNTEGWRCERCKSEYWGNPIVGCQSCDCYNEGAENNNCDSVTGQCLCKKRFSGQKCDECDLGYADIDLKCLPCECNLNGSLDITCDRYDGQCKCKFGVGGIKCDQCQDEFFGLSFDGCEECQCNPTGSVGQVCDRHSGQCVCHSNVIGRRCEKCLPGTWNMTAGIGCISCLCDSMGSLDNQCNPWSGQCNCKTGVGGLRCDECIEDFYGFSSHGCKRCDICESEGYVCDPDTGRCICPQYSKGTDCRQCLTGTWGWQPKLGCLRCDCDLAGSIGQSCDTQTGQCICREGYFGRRCDSCAGGYYDYPECRRCDCSVDGSIPRIDGLFECDFSGQCKCKDHVTGLKCDTCQEGTFGLSKLNREGCTKCFCFGRTHSCEQSNLSWGLIRMPGARNLSVQYIQPTRIPSSEYEYIVVVQMEGSQTYREDAEIKSMNGLNLIPSSTGNISIGAYTAFYYPLYFQLPPQFYGDKTTSYGGHIRFNLLTEPCNTQLEEKVLQQFPIVQIHSHNKLILDYYEKNSNEISQNESYSIPLHEAYWKFHQNKQDISRAIMMAALQNIKHIFIKGTSWADFTQVVLYNVQMDAAIYLSGSTNSIAQGIEKCHCPNIYDGYSCQNPGKGHYRWRNQSIIDSLFLEDLIGRVVPCNCNDRSDLCERETGICLDCQFNTGGNYCERCAEGYYGDPNYGGCKPCPCPETSRNFARGCTIWMGQVSCICKPGYTGPLCEKCRPGYFGSPDNSGGKCEPCACNLEGVVSEECDRETGQCRCLPGVTGRKCDMCLAERHVLEDRKCKLCDNCTLILLDYAELISNELRRELIHLDLSHIPAPWRKLQEYENKRDELLNHLQDYLTAKTKIEQFDENALEKLNSHSENTKYQWRRLEGISKKWNIASGLLLTDVNDFDSNLKLLCDDIKNEISKLRNYVVKGHHIDLPTALGQAQRYLNEIRSHDDYFSVMKESWKCAWDNYKFFENAINVVQDQQSVLEMFWRNFRKTSSRILDGMQLVENILETLKNARDLLEHISNYKKVLIENHENEATLRNDIRNLLNNSLIPSTDVTLEIIGNQYEEFDTVLGNIEELRNTLNKTLYEDLDKRKELKTFWVPETSQYAEKLMRSSSEYVKKFQTTKDAAKMALLASSAHKNISDAIDTAKVAAKEARLAVIKSQELLKPMKEESVIEKAKISFRKSEKIQKDAMKEMEKTNNLKKDLNLHEDSVESIKSTIRKAGIRNNEISSAVDVLNNKKYMEVVFDTINLAGNVSEETQKQTKKVADIKADFPLLRQRFANLEPDWDTKLGLAEENISQTLSHIREASNSLNSVEMKSEKTNAKFQLWNDTVSKQIQELKDKIAKARHAAEGIKISLESLTTKCIRSYMPKSYGLSTSNNIKLSFALNNKNGNSPLIFIQGKDRRYIALELIKRKIRLIWNLGGDTGFISHSLEIHPRDPKYDDAWYHIEANRTLNVGSLLVRRMTNLGVLSNEQPVIGTTDSEHTRFFTSTKDRIWLGGVPNNADASDLLKDPGLNVVVHQISVDNRALGLWNFIHSEGQCGGAMIGAQESSAASNARHFNGFGYAEVHKSRPRPYRKNLFALQMTFRTFDENALLFLAVDDKNNRSVSVTISKGHIVFRIDYGDEAKLEINTTEKYNTGKWVNVEAAREFVPRRGTENGSLKVNTQATLTGSPTTPIKSHMLPDLSAVVYYLGGVPPGFRSGSTKAPGADNRFMGCMMDVQINGETYDPLQSSSFFGIEQSCKEIITKAGFYGKGYIELTSQSLKKKSNIGFVFRTLQPDCLLLLSAYPPEVNDDYDSKDLRGNYSISLIEGHVIVWIQTGRDDLRLFSNVTTNDGEFHVINLIKFGRKIELWVDDDLQMTTTVHGSPTVVNMPKDAGGLYFGGAPDYPSYKLLSPTYIGFEGAIQDIVLNNRTVSLSDVKSFKNVQIGRSGPIMGTVNGGNYDILLKTEPIGKSFAASGEGCQRVGSYSYEPNAFKFGDGTNSHSQINISIRHFWQKNFHITFDFRTFYPNGIILMASGTKEKQKHFVLLLLKDGHLTLIVRGRRKEELNLTARLNDGQWHHVSVTCQDRKLTMSVEIGATEQKTSAQMKIPKKIGASNIIFVGGLPENGIILPTELLMRLETFKGCIRKMTVNNSTQDLARPGKHIHVGQCFPKVEKGTFFPGDAYVIYKKNFHVGKYLELELEFRTSELNGILLSVSEPVGFPALSLELHNGNVIFSCDFGDGNPFRVESIFPSKYTICDNKWHNISALYNFEQLTIRIDNNQAITASAQQNVIGKIHTKSALYIGGLPDTVSSGSLITRENFKGCMRSVSIRNEKRDWIDMDSLHNVLLSECLFIN